MLSGRTQFDAPCEWTHEEGGGMWFGVVLQGAVVVDTDGTTCDYLASLDSFAWLDTSSVPMRHIVPEAQDLHTIFVNVPEVMRGTCSELDAFCDAATMSRQRKGAIPNFYKSPVGTDVHAIARQIVECRHEGSLRGLYLEAKSLELLVAMVDQFQGNDSGAQQCVSCPRGATGRRLMEARNILISELQSPPSLEELARRIGMSTSAMTAGFRRLFTQSIFEFVQERRLDHAFVALREGHMTVSQAAYSAGYSRAHFSTLFRRRFGMTPGEISRCR
ncbi:AraC family transcriptional regulator [Hyphomicrobium nitrativorans NL23]|uniref:AraC family transcriptional regulator n=2 Tax=Hyphomicrobium TaxID=81 RepID=V5SI09_9HYPH|nr:AraC family transcriptional regulator [Hyphomicrobium nitrativorans NL23]